MTNFTVLTIDEAGNKEYHHCSSYGNKADIRAASTKVISSKSLDSFAQLQTIKEKSIRISVSHLPNSSRRGSRCRTRATRNNQCWEQSRRFSRKKKRPISNDRTQPKDKNDECGRCSLRVAPAFCVYYICGFNVQICPLLSNIFLDSEEYEWYYHLKAKEGAK